MDINEIKPGMYVPKDLELKEGMDVSEAINVAAVAVHTESSERLVCYRFVSNPDVLHAMLVSVFCLKFQKLIKEDTNV